MSEDLVKVACGAYDDTPPSWLSGLSERQSHRIRMDRAVEAYEEARARAAEASPAEPTFADLVYHHAGQRDCATCLFSKVEMEREPCATCLGPDRVGAGQGFLEWRPREEDGS